jgi:ABC-2 type transport system permease protein
MTLGRLLLAELRLVLASRLAVSAWLAFVLVAALALVLGVARSRQEDGRIARALTDHRADLEARATAAGAGTDAGQLAYDTYFVVADPPSSWAFLATGMRDTATYLQRIRLLGLEAQLYDSEASHPEIAATGTFDFAFVVVFLLPLLVIALGHDQRSADHESGRLAFLRSLAGSDRSLWGPRVTVRIFLASLAVVLPFVAAGLALQPGLLAGLQILASLVLYTLFWSLVVARVALRPGRSSTHSAVTLLVLWATQVLVLPALANHVLALTHPAPQGAEIALAQRKKVNDAWDLPKSATFEAFFVHHPEWRETPPVTGRFHWKWYYAFHQLGDESVAELVSRYENALRARERWSDRLGWVLPPVALQNLLSRQAETGLDRQMQHRRAIREFHQALRRMWYPFVFEERAFTATDFARLPRFSPAPRQQAAATASWGGLAVALLVAAVISGRGYRYRRWWFRA